MQPRDEKRAGHATRVAHGWLAPLETIAPRRNCVTLDGMSALLTSRRHIDLQRFRSAICSPA